MSGLAVFFRNHLPQRPDEGAAPPPDADTAYQQSFATVHENLKANHAAAEETGDESTVAAVEDYQTYQEIRKMDLIKFLRLRIVGDDEEEDEEEEEAENQKANHKKTNETATDDEDDVGPETQQLEPVHQEEEKNQGEHGDESDGGGDEEEEEESHKKSKLSLLPHISETSQAVSNISEIDLYASKVHLNLCTVDKVWGYRSTRRHKNHPSKSFDCFQNDGLLDLLYKHVFTIEIQQCFEQPATELRQRAEQLHNINHNHSCKVFLYNAYAEQFQKIQQVAREKQKKLVGSKITLYVALRNIPAKCVLPYEHANNNDWYETAQFSLCIGDRSNMSITEPGAGKTKIRFDTEDMRIDCLLVNEATGVAVAEYRIAPHTAAEHAPSDVTFREKKSLSGKSPIQRSYAACCQQQQDDDSNNNNNNATDSATAAAAVNPTADDTSAPNPAAAAASKAAPPKNGSSQQQQQRNGGNNGNGPRRHRNGQSSSSNGGARKKQRTDKVRYEPINDFSLLLEMNANLNFTTPSKSTSFVDLFAAVLSFTQPSMTTRGDWMMNLALVDESVPTCENEGNSTVSYIKSVTINIFVKFEDKARLPMVRYAGDVVRFHRVKLQRWKDEIQLLGVGEASYVVFRGNVDDPDATTEMSVFPSSENSVVTDEDMERGMNVWKWAQRRIRLHATMKAEHSFKLSDVGPQDSTQMEWFGQQQQDSRGDLTCMVTAMLPVQHTEATDGISPRGFLRLWDGTGPPTSDRLPIDNPIAREAVRTGDPPAAALVKLAGMIKKIRKLRQNPNLLPPKQLTGRVVSLAVWETQHWDLIQEGIVTVGSFIRLRNINDSKMTNADFRCLMVHHKSSFTPLPDLTFEVMNLIEEHNNRLLRQDPINPDSGILPFGAEGDLECVGPTGPTTQSRRAQPSQPLTALAAAPQHQTATQPLGSNGRAAQNGATDAPALHFQKLQDFVTAPPESTFEGYIRVVSIFPSERSLSSEGLQQIFRKKKGASSDDDLYYYFGLTIEEETSSFSVETVVSETISSVGPMVFGMSASAALTNKAGALYNLRTFLEEKSVWKAKVRIVAHNGTKWYALVSLTEGA